MHVTCETVRRNVPAVSTVASTGASAGSDTVEKRKLSSALSSAGGISFSASGNCAQSRLSLLALPEYDNNNYQRRPLVTSIARIIEPLAVGSVFIVLIGILGWIIRGIMNHRRWLRVSKLQTDMQNKLLERFTSNEEMLAFIQTSAGQRFLESASVAAEPGPRTLSAPVGRMLWSIQLGIVILVAGARSGNCEPQTFGL